MVTLMIHEILVFSNQSSRKLEEGELHLPVAVTVAIVRKLQNGEGDPTVLGHCAMRVVYTMPS